jgi:transcription initiation factor IIE alpha subunit
MRHSTQALVLYELEERGELTFEELVTYTEAKSHLVEMELERLKVAKFIIKIRRFDSKVVYNITSEGTDALSDYVGRVM